ncbi:ATP-binding protein [Actinoplanes sp. NPDC024001]|uniref:ATP-binding protein n=1 Tax=Actinoplanes sp. NPDC024001 TaxID=3154598 RepID=UPI0033C68CFB
MPTPHAASAPDGYAEQVWALVSTYGPDVTRLCRAAPALLPDVAGLGLSAGDDVLPQVRFSSDPASARMEELQYTLGEGPCRDVSASRASVMAADLDDESWARRWPRFTPGVRAAGVRALYALPLHAGGVHHHGAVDLYRSLRGSWNSTGQAASVFAAAVTELLTLERLDLDLATVFARARQPDGGSNTGERPAAAAPDRPGQALLVSWFGRRTVIDVRRQVQYLSHAQGLHGDRLYLFVLAVHEAVTNVVRHAGGHGQLLLWRSADRLCCEISDQGAGLPPDSPAPARNGASGLSVIRRACPTLEVMTDATGTRLRLSSRPISTR